MTAPRPTLALPLLLALTVSCDTEQPVADDTPDVLVDTAEADTRPPLATLGAACERDTDCISGRCGPGALGSVCVATCGDGCEEGTTCTALPEALGGDAVCLGAAALACQPCREDADCGLGACLSWGDAGSYCAAPCDAEGGCDAGYACDAERANAPMCVPEDADPATPCACNTLGKALALATDCAVANEAGSCGGERRCTVSGMTRCFARIPETERCNDRDDDCDGETDEDLPEEGCEASNSFGTCAGEIRCVDGAKLCAVTAPSAEVCDGVDNDCDGETDEGAPDLDGDGTVDCLDDDRDGDETPNAADCAPDDASVHPGAPERCDGMDSDCDGLGDEATAEGCGAQAACRPVDGTWACVCDAGYLGDGATCSDVDECQGEGEGHTCDLHATCVNTPGSYACTCAAGYAGDGTSCVDVDECQGEGDGSACDAHASCGNTDGSYVCACDAGFSGDGFSCEDLDECQGEGDGNDCHANATCTNTPGGFTCACRAGYQGDGRSCVNVDECADGSSGCAQTCVDSDGGFACACGDGYTRDVDGRGCTACAPGTADLDGDDRTACEPCPAGWVQPDAGQVSCLLCGAGTYDHGAEDCRACNTGFVQPDAGQTGCDLCPPGTFDDGTEYCAACPGGTVRPEEMGSECIPCPPRTYDDGTEYCASCPAGSVQPEEGQTECLPCPAGTYFEWSGVCTACPLGTVQPEGEQLACDACPVGTYDDGSEVCAACPAGSAQASTGQAACEPCEAGVSYQDQTGRASCLDCAACGAEQYVAQACTATTDTVCGSCGTIAGCAQVSCTGPGDATCAACADGFVDDGAGGCVLPSCGRLGPCPGGFACVEDSYCLNAVAGTVYVPAGDFWMGCNAAVETCDNSWELPQHLVTLSAYAIDQTEVTAAEYETCVSAGACSAPPLTNDPVQTYQNGKPAHPINFMSPDQAAAYCGWAGKPAGVQALCTEAQWERAAKGGCETRDGDCRTGMPIHPWGNAPASCTYAVLGDGAGGTCGGPRETRPVGSIPAGRSPYGALDMEGNVIEWVRDWWADYGPEPVANPSADSGTFRVQRSSAFNNVWSRSSYRWTAIPTSIGKQYGFRCCSASP